MSLARTTFLYRLLIKCSNACSVFFSIVFLDDFSGYLQIPIDPRDQEKTTFTCPSGTFLIKPCLLDYAMHRPPFKDTCQLSFMIWWKSSWKSSWMTSRFLVIHLKIVFLTSILCLLRVKIPIWSLIKKKCHFMV